VSDSALPVLLRGVSVYETVTEMFVLASSSTSVYVEAVAPEIFPLI
jgi:hypothetical protein